MLPLLGNRVNSDQRALRDNKMAVKEAIHQINFLANLANNSIMSRKQHNFGHDSK